MKMAGSIAAEGSLWTKGAAAGPLSWQIAEEVPVAIMVNSEPLTVMMATPADLVDMAAGFLVGEGYVSDINEIGNVLALPTEKGFCVDVALSGVLPDRVRSRSLESRSGCGVCGMRELTDVVRTIPYRGRVALDPDAVAYAFSGLSAHQPMNADNHSVHAAAFATPDGTVVLAREDVGRHNALDKLIGAVLRAGRDPASGFAVMSSRCSFELVQKAAVAELGGLATLSAPTALALDVAKASGLPLACRAPGGVAVF